MAGATDCEGFHRDARGRAAAKRQLLLVADQRQVQSVFPIPVQLGRGSQVGSLPVP